MRWKIRIFCWMFCFVAGFLCGSRKDALWQNFSVKHLTTQSLLVTSASVWNRGRQWVSQATGNLNAVGKRVWHIYRTVRDNTSPPSTRD